MAGVDCRGPTDAPVVIFVHGAGISRKMWLPQIHSLSDHFWTIAPDLPGHGERADEPFRFEVAVERSKRSFVMWVRTVPSSSVSHWVVTWRPKSLIDVLLASLDSFSRGAVPSTADCSDSGPSSVACSSGSELGVARSTTGSRES